MNERSAEVMINGQVYELILTTKATKEIAKKYGGLQNLGDKMLKSENFELALSEIVWLLTLLINQSILIHNFEHPEDRKALLEEEMVELFTTPADFTMYKEAITVAMYKGMKREIKSEETGKNQ